MKPRILLFSSFTGLLVTTGSAQLQRIVLQGSGVPQVFTNIDSALAAAQPNDKLYFSGGTFLSPAAFTISMPLHFIGAGVDPDSTDVTNTTTISTGGTSQNIIFTTATSGSTFTGIRFNPSGYVQYGTNIDDDDPVDMVFQRCMFQYRVSLSHDWNGSSSSTLFDECIFLAYVTAHEGASATFTRCIFDGTPDASISLFLGGAVLVDHCVFLDGKALDSCQGAVVSNCVFTRQGYPLNFCSNATVTNCLVVGDVLALNSTDVISVDNQLDVPLAGIFVNETDNNYQFEDDLNLATGSGGIGAADDGTDIGIYGSSSPYKLGAVPFNPHFSSATIAPATNTNGELPVNIRAVAQPN